MRKYGLAQILDINRSNNIVHIRFFSYDEKNDKLFVSIGHIPILFSALESLVYELHEVKPVSRDAIDSVLSWRKANVYGEAGAFSIPLGEAIELVWSVIYPSKNRMEKPYNAIESAYPICSTEGNYNKIRIICKSEALAGQSVPHQF